MIIMCCQQCKWDVIRYNRATLEVLSKVGKDNLEILNEAQQIMIQKDTFSN